MHKIFRLDLNIQPVFVQYLYSVSIILAIAAISFPFKDHLGYQSVGLLMLFSVIILPLLFNRGPILLAGILSALIWNFFFIPPLFTFHIHKFQDVIMLGLNFTVAIVTGFLTTRIKNQQKILLDREEKAISLYRLTSELSQAKSKENALEIIIEHLDKLLDAPVKIYIVDKQGKLKFSGSSRLFPETKEENEIGLWALNNNAPAGRFTEHYSSSRAYYAPINSPRNTIGVLCIYLINPLTKDQNAQLSNYITQFASSYERELSDEYARNMSLAAESEKLYKTFINSVSHEFRTPIAIIQAASSVMNDINDLKIESVKELSTEILSASKRMDRLVENLLNTTRLESGSVLLHYEWHDINDIVRSVINDLNMDLKNHNIQIHIEERMQFILTDYAILSQSLSYIIQNAAFYTPLGSKIKIIAYEEDSYIFIIIEDNGAGIPEHELERVFDKFYRLKGAKAGGTGLGLSICRGFIEALGGSVSAENSIEGGAKFIIKLPNNQSVKEEIHG